MEVVHTAGLDSPFGAMACVSTSRGLCFIGLPRASGGLRYGAAAEQVEPPLFAAIWAVVASGLVLHLARTDAQRLRLALQASAVGLAFGAVAWWVAAQLLETTSRAAVDTSRVWTSSLERREARVTSGEA